MVKLDATKIDEYIIITADSFEHLLNCLDNQKPIGEVQPCSSDDQKSIDNFNRQCRKLLNAP